MTLSFVGDIYRCYNSILNKDAEGKMEYAGLLDTMIDNARKALNEFEPYTQEQVDECVKSMCLAFKKNAVMLAELAKEETRLGDVNAKIEKNIGSADAIWFELKGKKS